MAALELVVSEAVYEGLHRTIGRRRISQFIEKLARPDVVAQDIEASYCEMATDQAREQDALELFEGVIVDSSFAESSTPDTRASPENRTTRSGGQEMTGRCAFTSSAIHSVTDSNRRVRTRTHGGVAGLGG